MVSTEPGTISAVPTVKPATNRARPRVGCSAIQTEAASSQTSSGSVQTATIIAARKRAPATRRRRAPVLAAPLTGSDGVPAGVPDTPADVFGQHFPAARFGHGLQLGVRTDGHRRAYALEQRQIPAGIAVGRNG